MKTGRFPSNGWTWNSTKKADWFAVKTPQELGIGNWIDWIQAMQGWMRHCLNGIKNLESNQCNWVKWRSWGQCDESNRRDVELGIRNLIQLTLGNEELMWNRRNKNVLNRKLNVWCDMNLNKEFSHKLTLSDAVQMKIDNDKWINQCKAKNKCK